MIEKIKIDSKFADQSGEIMIVELGGHVDQSNSYQLQKMFDNIIESGCFKVIVDFGQLFYMSSAGWGVFVGEIKRFRENGGDIKLANMNPEIYDVYQMLEFYHILDDYLTVEDAAASFKKAEEELNLVFEKEQTVYLQQVTAKTETSVEEISMFEEEEKQTAAGDASKSESSVADFIDFAPGSDFGKRSIVEFIPHTVSKDVKLADLPITEKVKRVVAQNPLIGVFGIRKILRHEHFGRTRIGLFRLMSLLKDLDLNSREKRYRYYRSC